MISASQFRKRPVRVGFIFATFLVIMYLSSLLDGAYENFSSQRKNELELIKTSNFPIRELSGLFIDQHETQPGVRTVLGIGDFSAEIGIGTYSHGELTFSKKVDFSKALIEQFALCSSLHIQTCKKIVTLATRQWEAIARDKERIFILNEQLATIVSYNLTTHEIDRLINFESFSLTKYKERLRSIADHENALGEGFVLLKNGNILVAKERFKPSIVEFGPADSIAQGYSPGEAVTSTEVFPMPHGKHLHMQPLRIWKIPKRYRNCDLSELSQDSNGKLFLLSQKCQWIAQISKLNLQNSNMTFKQIWHLPRSIKAAEALVIPDDHTFIVAEDKKNENKPNLHILSRANTSNPNT